MKTKPSPAHCQHLHYDKVHETICGQRSVEYVCLDCGREFMYLKNLEDSAEENRRKQNG